MESTNFDHFFTLKEIQSIHKLIEKSQKVVSDQELRLEKLQHQKIQKEEEIQDCLKELNSLNDKIKTFEIQNQNLFKTIEQASQKFNTIKSNQELELFKKQQADLESQKNQSETSLYAAYEEQENLSTQIKDNQSFLVGFEKTYVQISSEANQIIQTAKQEISGYETRVDLLLKSLPKSFFDRYQLVFNKFKLNSITIINGTTCGTCHFLISKLQISQVDKGNLECCPNCGRIFLPHKTQS